MRNYVANHFVLVGIVKCDRSELIRETCERSCLYIIDRLAVVADVGGNVGGVKMAGKHEVHACVRERLRALHPIVKHESTEYFGLYGHVRDDVVVTHTDDGLTVLLRLLALLEDPLHKLGGYPACGILNIVTTIGDVRGIPVGIHNDEPVAALEANCIGELARFALCGGEDILIGVCDEVAAEILVDLAEFVGSRDFCRLLYTVFKGYSVIVVDVVVAVDSNDVNTGLLLEGLELCSESHMTLI